MGLLSKIASSKIGKVGMALAGVGTAAIPITYDMLNPPAAYASQKAPTYISRESVRFIAKKVLKDKNLSYQTNRLKKYTLGGLLNQDRLFVDFSANKIPQLGKTRIHLYDNNKNGEFDPGVDTLEISVDNVDENTTSINAYLYDDGADGFSNLKGDDLIDFDDDVLGSYLLQDLKPVGQRKAIKKYNFIVGGITNHFRMEKDIKRYEKLLANYVRTNGDEADGGSRLNASNLLYKSLPNAKGEIVKTLGRYRIVHHKGESELLRIDFTPIDAEKIGGIGAAFIQGYFANYGLKFSSTKLKGSSNYTLINASGNIPLIMGTKTNPSYWDIRETASARKTYHNLLKNTVGKFVPESR